MPLSWSAVTAFARRHHVALRTLALSTAITVVVMLADLMINVVLMPGVTPYTPIGTFVIVLLITPPCVYALLRQTEQVRQAKSHLAAEQAQRAALEAAAAARNTFLANTSHELRTPLNGIIGYSELMMEAAQDEGRASDAADHQRVVALGQRLLHLLNDLLDLAKVEAGRMTLAPHAYDVREMLQEAVAYVDADIARNRNTITLHIDESLRGGHADTLRLRQCVLNLLTNAAKFTSDGAITLSATREAEGGVDWLCIEVNDTGIGIAPDRQVLLFEPFMQAEASSAPHGTGLGLAVTRQLARLMGGDISVRSAPNQGSCFTLRLPLYTAAASNDNRVAA